MVCSQCPITSEAEPANYNHMDSEVAHLFNRVLVTRQTVSLKFLADKQVELQVGITPFSMLKLPTLPFGATLFSCSILRSPLTTVHLEKDWQLALSESSSTCICFSPFQASMIVLLFSLYLPSPPHKLKKTVWETFKLPLLQEPKNAVLTTFSGSQVCYCVIM